MSGSEAVVLGRTSGDRGVEHSFPVSAVSISGGAPVF